MQTKQTSLFSVCFSSSASFSFSCWLLPFAKPTAILSKSFKQPGRPMYMSTLSLRKLRRFDRLYSPCFGNVTTLFTSPKKMRMAGMSSLSFTSYLSFQKHYNYHGNTMSYKVTFLPMPHFPYPHNL